MGSIRTNDLELQRLVLPDSLAVSVSLMNLTSKVFDRLVVEQAIRVDTTGYLWNRRSVKPNPGRREYTHNIPLVHLAADLCSPGCQRNL